MLKAVIFDMDGILVNSPEYNRQAYNIVLKEKGINLTKDYWRKNMGRSLIDQVKTWKKDFKFHGELEYKEILDKKLEVEKEFLKKGIIVSPFLKIFLNELKDNKINMAVATSSTKDRTKRILELMDLKKFFDVLISSEDVQKHKPNPDVFLKAAEKLNVKPEDCVVFEDAVNGVHAAKKAGMKVVALITEFSSEEDFKDITNIIINDFSEINLEKLNELF